MKLLPRSLFGQVLLALFAGLIALQALGFWLMLDERIRLGERLRGAYTAQRIAGIIAILDHAELSERERLLRALNVPPTRLTLDESWEAPTEQNSDDAKIFLDQVIQEVGRPIEMQVLAIRRAETRWRDDPGGPRTGGPRTGGPRTGGPRTGDPRTGDPRTGDPRTGDPRTGGPRTGGPREGGTPARHAISIPSDDSPAGRRPHGGPPIAFLLGQVRLSGNQVLTFRHALPHQALDWPLRLFGLLSTLAILVALLAGWAVRKVTRPLAVMADAAGGLARNLEQPPLPEQGPQEVMRAAQAFNAMQRDLKRYLETRAHALAGVSHDLRIPLTRLRLRLERLPEGELRSKMEDDLSEMDKMISNTLEFLRAGAAHEKALRLDLNALVESVSEDMIAFGAEIRIHGRSAEPVSARPQALRRCLMNLLDNARRYGSAEIDLSIAQAADTTEIRIEDRGAGIPSSERERVFEPYVRLESSRARHTGGSGLGLAIARAVARAHGGDVTLSARDGGGTCATLTLPRKADD